MIGCAKRDRRGNRTCTGVSDRRGGRADAGDSDRSRPVPTEAITPSRNQTRNCPHFPYTLKTGAALSCALRGEVELSLIGRVRSPSSVESGPTLDRSETKGCEGFAWNRTNTSVIASPRGRPRLSRGCGGGSRIIRESRTPPSRVLPPRPESTPARRPTSAIQRKWAAPKKGRTSLK